MSAPERSFARHDARAPFADGAVLAVSPPCDLISAGSVYDRVRANLARYAGEVWPLDRLSRLVDGHEAGLSFLTIARRLGGGVTRNACIGKGRRIGLPQRDRDEGYRKHVAQQARLLGQRREAKKAAKAPPAPPRPPKKVRPISDVRIKAALALPGLSPVMISDLSPNQCRWPVGDPKAADFAFCGRLKADGGSYCTEHHHAGVDHAATQRARRSKLDRVAQLTTPRRNTPRAA